MKKHYLANMEEVLEIAVLENSMEMTRPIRRKIEMKKNGKSKVDVQGELNNVETKKTRKIEDIANEMWNAIIMVRELVMLEITDIEDPREIL